SQACTTLLCGSGRVEASNRREAGDAVYGTGFARSHTDHISLMAFFRLARSLWERPFAAAGSPFPMQANSP
ncbi:hypothetical protein, partial [Pseudomonas sp. KCJK8751]